MASNISDLVDMLDSPVEDEAHEYKCWMDLEDEKVKRDIAKHIAALANFGGGFLVFGFHDSDLRPDTAVPTNFDKTFNRDYINLSIVGPYLEPQRHCDVHIVESPTTGNRHAIVRIASHGPTPICFRKGGPTFDGTTTGLAEKDAYYIRKSGPRSEPILTAHEWKPVFQRCVLYESEHQLAAMRVLTEAMKALSPEVMRPVETPTSATARVVSEEAAKKFFMSINPPGGRR